jgi:hypothetical protein
MVRNPHAGQPFTSSDEQIADALLDVSIPTLMLSLVHMSEDPTLIRGALKPAGLFLNEVQGCRPSTPRNGTTRWICEESASPSSAREPVGSRSRPPSQPTSHT